ncbi:MAG: phage integrase N-terminal SAM-like domain-containing protein, partial [Peptococcaceae bacterium]|nr:phage integrase N-terminal SAM-like domain-containing protein [Peptococcaceae bacterium]
MDITVKNAIEEFLIEQQIRGNSSRTHEYYRQNLDRFACFLPAERKYIDSVSLADCKGYYLRLAGNPALTSSTVQTYIRAVRAFLSWCFEQRYLCQNIPERFKL